MRTSLCVGNYSTTPYMIMGLDVQVYCAEELCYYLKENVFLLDTTLMGDGLLRWLEQECGLAELAGLSDRTYADIERGTVNMRLETLLHICRVYGATPDEILVSELDAPLPESELLARLHRCTPQQQATALTLLAVYLGSLD